MKKLSAFLVIVLMLLSITPAYAAEKEETQNLIKSDQEETAVDYRETTTQEFVAESIATEEVTSSSVKVVIPNEISVASNDATASELASNETGKSVKEYGAIGDGIVNDTAAIQKALDVETTVFIPEGIYLIDVDQSLKPKSNQKIILSDNAVLKAIPTSSEKNAVIKISGINNTSVTGGKIIGERNEHQGTTGEWGMGVRVEKGASNIEIRQVEIKDCWGDGIYLGDSPAVSEITIDNVICDNNRRQGLSITNANNVLISNSIFRNTNGTSPQAGIDIEPNTNQVTEDIKIVNSESYGNTGFGLLFSGTRGTVQRIEVVDSDLCENASMGIRILGANELLFDNNNVLNNRSGVEIIKDAANITFKNMNISKNQLQGIEIVSSNQQIGIENILFENSVVSNNSQMKPGAAMGARVINRDSSGFVRNVQFKSTQFIDDQKKPTQRYGLVIGTTNEINGVDADADCVFEGNSKGSITTTV